MSENLTANQLKNLRAHIETVELDRQVRESSMRQLLEKLLRQSENTEQKLADVLVEIGLLEARIATSEKRLKMDDNLKDVVMDLNRQNLSAKLAKMRDELNSHKDDTAKILRDHMKSSDEQNTASYKHAMLVLRESLRLAAERADK